LNSIAIQTVETLVYRPARRLEVARSPAGDIVIARRTGGLFFSPMCSRFMDSAVGTTVSPSTIAGLIELNHAWSRKILNAAPLNCDCIYSAASLAAQI